MLLINFVNKKRSEVDIHTTVQKPWGEYQILGDEEHFKAKKLTVYPGSGGLSIQRHKRRSEHWIVVSGIATVMLDEKIFELKKNESVFIPMGSKHRLLNNHDETLILVEVQTGDYFGEDDIERFDDIYGRA
jgi:mannose-6-phosphate isomerase-like protein (cupin superfamily)